MIVKGDVGNASVPDLKLITEVDGRVEKKGLARVRNRQFSYVKFLDSATGKLELMETCRQFAVYNPTAMVIKIALGGTVDTNNYHFIINSQKQVVFIPIDFNLLSFTIDSFVNTKPNAILIAYKNGILAPNISVVT